jgi:nitrate/TMAO reductase-like tetraheme cytochrome c subunit
MNPIFIRILRHEQEGDEIMEDEQSKQPGPDRSRKNFYKILTITLFSIVLLIVAGYSTVEATSSSGFCASCHEMKPEAATWKVSSHSQIACKECHIQPGVVNYAKAKINGLKQVYDKVTNSYTAPIQMKDPIPNSVCEKCHNMKDTVVTAPGDLIIPHDKHLAKGILCVQCHYGVVHGDISDRNVTFKTDYDKWNAQLAKQMETVSFTQPQMEDCIKCHQARNVSTSCKTCHSTGMKPASHNDPNFINNVHGQLAEKDIKQCNSCHQYMSDKPIPDLQTKTASQQFLSGTKKGNTISAQDYAKENTFCANCHGKKPASHDSDWINNHGKIASKDEQQCLACHSDKNTTSSTITSNGLLSNAVPASTGTAPACTTCHPALHAGKDYKTGHPVDLTGITAPNDSCYTCHEKSTCTTCHKEDGGQSQGESGTIAQTEGLAPTTDDLTQ